MTWYDVDLEEEGVLQLNNLFSAMPYGVTEDAETGNIAYLWTGEKDVSFMMYSVSAIIMYNGVIKNFPKSLQQDLISRLKQVSSLGTVVKSIEKYCENEIF